MRPKSPLLLSVLLSSALPGTLDAQSPAGTWEGGLRLGGEYSPVTIQLSASGGELGATLDIPSRDLLQVPLVVDVEGDAMALEMDHAAKGRARFDGVIEDGLFTGVFTHEINGFRQGGRFETARVVEMDREQLRHFEGVYDVEGFGPMKIFVLSTATRLSLQAFALRLGNQVPLFPVGDSEFVVGLTVSGSDPVMARVRFEENEGAVVGMRFQRGRSAPVPGSHVDPTLRLDAQRLEARISELREALNVPSYSVGIVQGDDLIYAESFGVLDLQSNAPATPETLYQIGSLSKAFAATLYGILEEEGALSLDDPVRGFLPADRSFASLEGVGAKITLEHLLTHTSGLPRDPTNRPDVEGGIPAPYGVEELYAGGLSDRLLFTPGEYWNYSNLGFGLLGHVLSRVGDKPFEDLLRERVLEPLMMRDTSIALTPEREARLATHYCSEDPNRRPKPRWVFGEIAANGGVVSNVVDLAKFMSLQFRAGRDGVEPISGAALRRLQEPRRRRAGWNETIGLGWWIDDTPEAGTIVSHGGEVDGHSTHFAFSPRYEVGVIVLANFGGGTAFELGSWLMDDVVQVAREQHIPSDTEASTWYARGEWADAAAAYGVMAAASPGIGMFRYRHGVSLYRMHRYAEAREALTGALEQGYAPASTHLALARIAAATGAVDRAFEELQAAVLAGLNPRSVERDEALRVLHRDPRFAELMRK